MEEKYYYLNKVFFGEQERGSKEHVDSRDHKLHMLTQRVMNFGTKEALDELQAEIDHRRHVDGLFEIFSAVPSNNGNVQDYDCLREMVGAVEELCGVWSDYSLKYVGKLADTCDSQSGEKINEYIQKMRTYCQAY